MTVGAQIGYRYSDGFTAMTTAGLAQRVDVNAPDQLMEMLFRKRVHAIIRNDLMVRYYLQQEPYSSQLKVMPLTDARISKFCAYSPRVFFSIQPCTGWHGG
ncbi:hypothetical protein [Hahella ganghwensis]|uniref:hypothetical protein n=1 Tax=Hahella ganghwensis TaxID=286420 RepID=UPI00037AAE45|nr:hypothetical protein [Hahella ganghwensis]